MPIAHEWIDSTNQFFPPFSAPSREIFFWLGDSAGWTGLESLWTKPRSFAKRSNPGHQVERPDGDHGFHRARPNGTNNCRRH